MSALVLSFAATACNSESSGTQNTDGSNLSGNPSGSNNTNNNVNDPNSSNTGNNNNSTSTPNVAVGESCESSQSDKICLAMKWVVYKDSNGAVTANEAQSAAIVKKTNELFAQCKIGFQIETYAAVDPVDYGLSYGSASQNETTSIRRTFMNNNQILSVTTGPWGTAVNAWTSMPGEGTYGAIMEKSIVEYGNGIIYAHEFGHYLGLDHYSDQSDLMNSVIYTTSSKLTTAQCEQARDTAMSYWAAMMR